MARGKAWKGTSHAREPVLFSETSDSGIRNHIHRSHALVQMYPLKSSVLKGCAGRAACERVLGWARDRDEEFRSSSSVQIHTIHARLSAGARASLGHKPFWEVWILQSINVRNKRRSSLGVWSSSALLLTSCSSSQWTSCCVFRSRL